jgi:hypothetical protein
MKRNETYDGVNIIRMQRLLNISPMFCHLVCQFSSSEVFGIESALYHFGNECTNGVSLVGFDKVVWNLLLRMFPLPRCHGCYQS